MVLASGAVPRTLSMSHYTAVTVSNYFCVYLTSRVHRGKSILEQSTAATFSSDYHYLERMTVWNQSHTQNCWISQREVIFSPFRAPTPSSIEMNSSSDNNSTRWVTDFFSPTFHWNSLVLLSILPLNMVPVVGVDHAPTTAFAAEAYTPSLNPPIVPEQLGSASGGELEIQPTVSDHAILTIVVANYWSFSTCLWPLIVHCRPRCLIP